MMLAQHRFDLTSIVVIDSAPLIACVALFGRRSLQPIQMVEVEEMIMFATPVQTPVMESLVGVYKFQGQWNNKPFYVKGEVENCVCLAMWRSGSARINSFSGRL